MPEDVCLARSRLVCSCVGRSSSWPASNVSGSAISRSDQVRQSRAHRQDTGSVPDLVRTKKTVLPSGAMVTWPGTPSVNCRVLAS